MNENEQTTVPRVQETRLEIWQFLILLSINWIFVFLLCTSVQWILILGVDVCGAMGEGEALTHNIILWCYHNIMLAG